MNRPARILLFLCLLFVINSQAQSFVTRKGSRFYLNGQPYYYIGANFWYGTVLGLEKNPQRGVQRLRKELDFLRSKGVTNLRVIAAAEGRGLVNGVERIAPPLQETRGRFDAAVAKGLDILLDEMGKRNMKAVVFLSNNWEWSGGFLQYLRWNNRISDSVFRRKLSWDEMRDYVSLFYTCDSCRKDYLRQVEYLLSRTNKVNGKKYTADPTIMSWELANEPRPMRPAAIGAYKEWIAEVAAFIKSRDRNHLVTTGVEGDIGTENLSVFQSIHSDPHVDYMTIHIWPKNWSWFRPDSMEADFPQVIDKTNAYIAKHLVVAERLEKPLVIEEFGLPRDNHSFDIAATTQLRDRYYGNILSTWQESARSRGPLAGVNFWAFAGTSRPVKGQAFWKKGDDYMGDPPMEEQGLNGVFDRDTSTWKLIYRYSSGGRVSHLHSFSSPAEVVARAKLPAKNNVSDSRKKFAAGRLEPVSMRKITKEKDRRG